MNRITRIAVLLSLLVGLAGLSFGQTALNQTTLSGAVNSANAFSGNGSASIDTSITVGATTGIVSQNQNSNQFANLYSSSQGGQFASELYVDRELMGVISVNTTTKVVQVVRGIEGTQVSDHASGTMVLAGPPSAFQKYDPAGSCTTASTLFTPWVNTVNGAQWLCSTITLTWAPGFNNPLVPIVNIPNTAVASATTILPTGPLFHLTGTTSVVNVTQPVGCNATAQGGCQFTAICDGVCTWSAAGNIAVAAGTVVAGTAITFIWDAKNSKWVPNVVT